MRVLLLGSGGRESALAWGLERAPSVEEIVAAPGNPGIEGLAPVIPVDPSDPGAVVALARRVGPDLVVVGPEAPLVAGVGDALRAEGFGVFGPNAAAARIEASKSYAKALMEEAGIPTASGRTFGDPAEAAAHMDLLGPPYVVKADGLAAGKGVVVTSDRAVALEAIEDRLVRRRFGDAGAEVVIEEFLDGPEASVIVFTDGSAIRPCEPAQDYKRLADGDLGPNTGGMGSYSPVPACPPELAERVVAEIIEPMVRATAQRGAPFSGALYAGLALTERGPRVIEFNARFGDPETQALIPRLTSDLGEVCMACATGELAGHRIEWSSERCVAVVLSSEGYPESPRTGSIIRGVEGAQAIPGVQVFHAGTARRDGDLVTAGGRVLAVSALAPTFHKARALAYDAASQIDFDGKHMRTDIALRVEAEEVSE